MAVVESSGPHGRDQRRLNTGLLIMLPALAMSVGWGFRGDYGHEAGAMVPGALLGLAIALTSHRRDWWERASLLAMLGAAGWAFGGQMSYGRIVGYTAHSSMATVAYGYASLFVVGALWAGIGSAFLALGVTESRLKLERFAGPVVALWLVWLLLDVSGLTEVLVRRWDLYDTDWVAASSALLVAAIYAVVSPGSRQACALIVLLAGGWWIGFAGLTLLAGLHMTPPRSDNWAGCVGLYLGAVAYLRLTRNRAGVMLTLYGLLAGGVGFAVADLVNMLGRAQWGPIGATASLRGLDYWKWMEQLFGLIMGAGVAVGFRRLLRGPLDPPAEDRPAGPLAYIAPVFLLVIMMWENLHKNVRNWARADAIVPEFWGFEAKWWFLLIGVLLSLVIVLGVIRHYQGLLTLVPRHPFGRAQSLFLLILWIPVVGAFMQAFPDMTRPGVFFVHLTFWLTAIACSAIVVLLRPRPTEVPSIALAPADYRWRAGGACWALWVLVPVLIWALAALSIRAHDAPLYGSHLRFPDPAFP